MTREDLEFLISQSLDGALPPDEAAALAALLEQDPEARALMAEYQKLDAFVKTALPFPEMAERQWDALADQIGAVVAEADVADAVHGSISLRGVEGMRVGDIRIGDLKAPRPRGLHLPLFRSFGRIAIAASLLLAALAGLRYWSTRGTGNIARIPTPTPTQVAHIDVAGPSVEVAAGPAVDEITIGPSRTLSQAQADARFADSVVTQGQRVVIASHIQSAQDSSLPY